MAIGQTYHDARTERRADVDIRDTRVDVHSDWLAFVNKNLFQKHSMYLACFHICVRYKIPFGTLWDGPTEPEAFLFGGPWLNQHVSGTWHL